MATWRATINVPRTGESVDEQTIGRPLSQLAERTAYLKDRLDAASVGEGLTLFSQPIISTISVGDVVYYNATMERYEPALAEAAEDDDGILRTGARAYVTGIIIRKLSSSAADILIQGRYSGLALTDTSSVALPNGNYYLSGMDAGKLVSLRPGVGIFVCSVTDQGVVVNPVPREVLEDHIHYRFELVVDPAGTPVCHADNRVSIEYADSDREGWLPADDPSFQELAPIGAFFGYNLLAYPALHAAWPPQPLRGAYLELNGVGISQDHVVVDDNGIWWMTNCNTDVPWESDECLSSSISLEQESSSSGTIGAGRPGPCAPITRRMLLWFTHLVSKTDQVVVTGVKSAEDSPIVVSGCAAPDASGYYQSKVELDLNLLWTRTARQAGSEVVKGVTGHGDLLVGQVVEGIQGAGLVTVSGSQSTVGGSSAGLVTITGLDPTQISRKVDVALVALSGATEAIYSGILPYVGLPAGRVSSFIGKVRVPSIAMTTPRLALDLWFGMPTVGTPPANVSIEYAVVNDAESTTESSSSLYSGGLMQSMPTTWSIANVLDLEDLGALAAGDYFSRRALVIGIGSNQLLLFRLSRTASDGYTGELAVINMVATVYDGAL